MSKRTIKFTLLASLLVLIALSITACQPQAAAEPCPECPTAEPCPECPACPEAPETVAVPFLEKWQESGHADAASESFVHWDEEGAVPESCAACHSEGGFMDFVGADGSEVGVVNAPAAIGTSVTCVACHNDATASYTTVKFPSGAEVSDLGGEAVCMTCHQGRASKVQVDASIEKAGLTDDDTPSADLGFTNIHYYAAAVSRYGHTVMGGYEYEGKAYDVVFDHVAGYQTCTECHDSHTLALKTDECVTCHVDASSVEGVRNIRMESSLTDYDGDGDIAEGVAAEIEGLNAMLFQAIQAYAAEVSGSPIAYNVHAHPYFFIDTNADGAADEAESVRDNMYVFFTGRLAKAAYNYQTILKDPGGYAHGGKYLIQLAYDSIESLNEKLGTPVDLSTTHREDPGHFASSTEAWRHWDEEGVVPAGCVKCHTAGGLPQFLAEGVNTSMAASSGLNCASCHNDLTTLSIFEVESVTFPSGAKVAFTEDPASNLCLQCHQGRESTVSVNRAIAGKDLDTPDEAVRFRNVHYFAAGSTVFGTDVKGMYEFDGKEYLGQYAHTTGFSTCTDCHDAHQLAVKASACAGCHQVDDPEKIRFSTSADDYDGDGDVTEGIAGEIETMTEKLYEALQAYSVDELGTGIIYSGSAYPYFFKDTNGNGEGDPDELTGANGYAGWSPRLLQGAYNLQYAMKDPGAFAHNPKYVMQVLFDTIEALGGDVTGMVRP